MARDRDIESASASRGRSGNDYLQRGGRGYESWGAEGPGGMSATGGPPQVDGTRQWHGAIAAEAAGADPAGAAAIGRGQGTRGEAGSRVGTLLAGIGIGAAIMYFLDPGRGARRRHVLADKAVSRVHDAQHGARDVALGMRNRATGTIAEVRGRLRDEEVSDDQLVARVRAELGHHVERVRPIEVVAEGGAVTLRGAVSAEDLPRVVATVERVRGVQRVVNNLEIRQELGGML